MKGIEFVDELEVECPFCHHQLMHVQRELEIILVDSKGEPETEKTEYMNKLVCTNCSEEFKFSKVGFRIRLGEGTDKICLSARPHPNCIYMKSFTNGFGYHNKPEEG